MADTISPVVEQYVLQEVQRFTERASDWLLRHAGQPDAMAAAVVRLRPSVRQLTARLRQGFPASAADQSRAAHAYLTAAAAPAALADRVAVLRPLAAALDIADVATATGADVEVVAGVQFIIGEKLDLDWLQSQIVDIPSDAHWVVAAKASLREDLAEHWAQLTKIIVVAVGGDPADPAAAVAGWLPAHPAAAATFATVRAQLRNTRPLDVAMLTVAGSAVRRLVLASTR